MTTNSKAEDGKIGSAEDAQRLMQMIMGFQSTQLIYVAAKLSLADLLEKGPQTAEQLAAATDTHAPSLYRVLRGLASFGIFAEDEQGRFSMTALAEPLRTGVPGSQRPAALVFGQPARWRAAGELLYSVTTGKPAFPHLFGMSAWEYRATNPEFNANFNDYMTANTTPDTAAVVAAYDFAGSGESGEATVIDVGGGHGILLSAILRANPRLKGVLADAPHVVAGAPALLEAEGVMDRCRIEPCDFFSSVPDGGDFYVLKFIIHDWDDDQAAAILANCRRAIADGGKLLLMERLVRPGNHPDEGKLIDLQMLVQLGGKERTEEEYGKLLGEAGFKLTRVIPTTRRLSIIEAVPV